MELYVHIPYCRQKCRYCDFASYACREDTMERYIDALLQEADAASGDSRATIDTVFIGGGTPSLLPPQLLARLLEGLHERFDVPNGIEFTSEANPGTLTADWLEAAVRGGVNRLSLGMQATQPELLRTLGRIHSHDQVLESVRLARAAGLTNINLDLMFGLPGQSPAQWLETLHAALALQPTHLSCYGLIPEEGTSLKRDLDNGLLSLPSEEDERRMYNDTLSTLSDHGFEQYEISNFALPGFECRHNIGYWQQVPYIGLGASAASMRRSGNGELRWSNPPGIDDYIDMVHHQQWSERKITDVTPDEARFETLMLGLRMTDGVSESDFLHRHGMSMDDCYGDRLRSLSRRGLLLHQDGHWRLTRRGMDVQNAILVELMDD